MVMLWFAATDFACVCKWKNMCQSNLIGYKEFIDKLKEHEIGSIVYCGECGAEAFQLEENTQHFHKPPETGNVLVMEFHFHPPGF